MTPAGTLNNVDITPAGSIGNKDITPAGTIGGHTLTAAELANHGHNNVIWNKMDGGGTPKEWSNYGGSYGQLHTGSYFRIVGGEGSAWTSGNTTQSGNGDACGRTTGAGNNGSHNHSFTGTKNTHNHTWTGTKNTHNHTFTGTSVTITNLPPYKTVYCFKRIS